MTKAEELAAQFVELYPQDLGPHHPAKWMMCDFLEQYGRLVQEAAAKEVSRYDVTIEADQTVTFKGSTYAQYIERMPLP